MLRAVMLACLCLALSGCVTNDITTQNAQVAAVAVAPPVRQPVVILTPTARLAGAREVIVHKMAKAGATLLLASPQSLAPDCSPLGRVGARVVVLPDHGVVHIAQGTAFPDYVPGDPPFACDSQRHPATIITYRAFAGYAGEDTVGVQLFFPSGKDPTLLFHIIVQ